MTIALFIFFIFWLGIYALHMIAWIINAAIEYTFQTDRLWTVYRDYFLNPVSLIKVTTITHRNKEYKHVHSVFAKPDLNTKSDTESLSVPLNVICSPILFGTLAAFMYLQPVICSIIVGTFTVMTIIRLTRLRRKNDNV